MESIKQRRKQIVTKIYVFVRAAVPPSCSG